MELLGTNDPSAAWRPRFKILVNDTDWSGWFVHGQIKQEGLFRNGTFILDFDLGKAGKVDPTTGAVTKGSPLDVLLTPHVSVYRDVVKIYMGYVASEDDTSQLPLVFEGLVDTIELMHNEAVATIEGRDRSAILQESFTHIQFRNKTVAGVVQEIADKHELQTNIVDPGTLVGTVFTEEHIDFQHVSSKGYNDWTLLTKLAEHDGYTVFITDGVLNYIPVEKAVDTIIFEYGTNIESIKMRKNLAVSHSRVTVEMGNVQLQNKSSAFVTAGAGESRKSKDGLSSVYRFTDFPSVDPETLGLVAEGLALMYAQMEHIVNITSTGAPQQALKNGLLVKGTGTVFDRMYRLTSVDWHFGYDYGWTSTIEGLQIPDTDQLKNYRTKQRRRSSAGSTGSSGVNVVA